MTKAKQAIVYSNLWVAMSCVAMYLLLGTSYQNHFYYPFFLLSATAGAYNYMRLLQKGQHQAYTLSGYKNWVNRHATWVAFLTTFFLTIAGFALFKIDSWKLIVALIPAGVVSALYPIRFSFENNTKFSLRQLPGLKLFIIALVWGYLVVLLPALVFTQITAAVVFNFCFTVFWVAALTIPFDMRDLRQDAPEMRTLPAVIGNRNAQELTRFVLGFLQAAAIVAFLFFQWDTATTVAILIALEICIWLVKKIPGGEDEYYTSFWIEGTPIMAFLLLWIWHSLLGLL